MVEVLRETKNAINARLDMLEMLVLKSNSIDENTHNDNDSNIDNVKMFMKDTNERFENIETMLYRFNDLISNIKNYIEKQQNTDILPRTIIIDKEDNNTNETTYETSIPRMIIVDKSEGEKEQVEEEQEEQEEEEQLEEEEQVEEQEEQEEQQEEQEEEQEQEQEQVEEQQEEQEEEQEEQEEGIELTEFEYKGMTLYHDADMKVYRMDEEGALSDVLGIYDAEKGKIRKI